MAASKPIPLSTLPRSAEIQDVAVRLFSPTDVTSAGLGADKFRELMDAATLLAAGDPTINAWQYSPWAEGTFSTPSGVYRVKLFLGGRGRLEAPEGDDRSGYFDVDRSTWGRIAGAKTPPRP